VSASHSPRTPARRSAGGGSYARTTDHVKTGSARFPDFDDDIVRLLNERGLNGLSG